MTFWTSAIALRDDAAVDVTDRFARDVRGRRYVQCARSEWHQIGHLVAAVGLDGGSSRGNLATFGAAVVVGTVRLDNRDAIVRSVEDCNPHATDLELVLRWLTPHLGCSDRTESHNAGSVQAALRSLLGDFAFVAWHPVTRRLIAARDAFGVKKLFCAIRAGTSAAFSSRAELLSNDETSDVYNVGYLVGLLSEQRFEGRFGVADNGGGPLDTRFGRTAFAGVRAVPAGGVVTIDTGQPHLTTFWSAGDVVRSDEVRVANRCSTRERIDTFRSLLLDAVRLRLDDPARTWSHLSGGLDSSSVVCVAEHLARAGAIDTGLGGTISFVEPAVTAADERVFSNAVVRKYAVRNHTVPHVAGWRDAIIGAPRFDQPNQSHLIAVRDAAAATIIRGAGGSTLLTGSGGDQLLLTTMFFFADEIFRGRVVSAVRENGPLGGTGPGVVLGARLQERRAPAAPRRCAPLPHATRQ